MGAKRKILKKVAKKLDKKAATKTAQRTKWRIKNARMSVGPVIPMTSRQGRDAHKTAKKVEKSIARNKRKKTKRVTRRKNRNLRKREERNWRGWTKELQPTEQASTRKKKVQTRKKTGRQVFSEDSPEDIAKFDRLIDRGKARNRAARRGNPRPTTPRQRMELQDQVKSAGIGHNVAGSRRRKARLQAVKDRMSARKKPTRSLGSRGKKPGRKLEANPSKLSDYEEKIMKDTVRKRLKPDTAAQRKVRKLRTEGQAYKSIGRKAKNEIRKSKWRSKADKAKAKQNVQAQVERHYDQSGKEITEAVIKRNKATKRKRGHKSRKKVARYPRKKVTRH